MVLQQNILKGLREKLQPMRREIEQVEKSVARVENRVEQVVKQSKSFKKVIESVERQSPERSMQKYVTRKSVEFYETNQLHFTNQLLTNYIFLTSGKERA